MEAFDTYQTPLSRSDPIPNSQFPYSFPPESLTFSSTQPVREQGDGAPLLRIRNAPFLGLCAVRSDRSARDFSEPVLHLAPALAQPRHRGEGARAAHLGRGRRADEGQSRTCWLPVRLFFSSFQ